MKRIYCFFITTLLLFSTIPSLQAQNISGKDFWVTFASVSNFPASSPALGLQIRIISGNTATTGNIHFTSLKDSVPFALGAHEVYTYSLTTPQIEAVYNMNTGITDYSIHITSVDSVVVYTYYGLSSGHGDATNILPTTTLGTEYYQISYLSNPEFYTVCYAVVATQDSTNLFVDGFYEKTLNEGQVYYVRNNEEMTGIHITSNYPIAFFSFNHCIAISTPACGYAQQQLPPTSTWGKNFFVPNSPHTLDRVRIVVTQNNTNIAQIEGGTLLTDVPGAQTTIDTLKAGQFVEIKISSNGCYIKANEPVGVCSFLSGENYLSVTPSQCWIPAIEQTIPNALIAPFFVASHVQLSNHYAFICTPTADTVNTRVSIGGASPTTLSGGSWIENIAANMSFYRMPLYQNTASYYFSNSAGLIVLCYGDGLGVSYYYPAGFSMRNLSAAFTANNIPYNKLSEHLFCEHDITFVANIEGIHPNAGSLKWYINGDEYVPARDNLEWNKNFPTGNYLITMSVLFEDNSTEIYQDSLKIANCEPVFYANSVLFENLQDTVFCSKNVHFQAEAENYTEIKWYVDGDEYVPENPLDWYKNFETGEYEIKMVTLFDNGKTATVVATLKIEILWIKIRNVRY